MLYIHVVYLILCCKFSTPFGLSTCCIVVLSNYHHSLLLGYSTSHYYNILNKYCRGFSTLVLFISLVSLAIQWTLCKQLSISDPFWLIVKLFRLCSLPKIRCLRTPRDVDRIIAMLCPLGSLYRYQLVQQCGFTNSIHSQSSASTWHMELSLGCEYCYWNHNYCTTVSLVHGKVCPGVSEALTFTLRNLSTRLRFIACNALSDCFCLRQWSGQKSR